MFKILCMMIISDEDRNQKKNIWTDMLTFVESLRHQLVQKRIVTTHVKCSISDFSLENLIYCVA